MNRLHSIYDSQSLKPGIYSTSGGKVSLRNIDNESFLKGNNNKITGEPSVLPMVYAANDYKSGMEPMSTKTSKTCSYSPFSSDRFHPTLKPFYHDKKIGVESRFESR